MTYRPDLHTPEHDQWDQGGYCNNLVTDDDGCGVVCGYRAPREPRTPTTQTVQELIAEALAEWKMAEMEGLHPWKRGRKLRDALEAAERVIRGTP